MFPVMMIETSDKSYFVDKLEQLTGKSRSYWARASVFQLREYLKKEMRTYQGRMNGKDEDWGAGI